jgi:type II secretory pathway pseudopilin PulG
MLNGSKETLPLQRSGFSLIGAVVSVSLIGIVVGFAVPRFTRLSNSARAAEVVALSSNLRHAAEAAHAQYVISGARLGSTRIGNVVFESEDFTIKASDDAVVFSKSDAPSASQCAVTYRAASLSGEAATITNLNIGGC